MHRHVDEHHQTGRKPQLPGHMSANPSAKTLAIAARLLLWGVISGGSACALLRRAARRARKRQKRVVISGRVEMLETRHLVKYFGPLAAVDDVSFTLPKGEVLGFLGPNGAG